MRWTLILVTLGALLAPCTSQAQSVAGAAVLQIPLDVRSEGMGRAYEILTLGPQAARANPGALGLLPGIQAYGMKAQLVPDLADDVRFKHGVLAVGFSPKADTPIRFSLGLNYTRLDYGETQVTDAGSPDALGTVEPFEDVVGATIAVGLGECFGFGVGIKQVGINLPDPERPLTLRNVDASAVDYGFLARSPRLPLDMFNTPEPIGTVRLLAAMAWGNRGDAIELLEGRGADPLPEVWRQSIGMELDFLPASGAFETRHGLIQRWLDNAHFLSFSAAVGREESIGAAGQGSGPGRTFTNHRGYELRVLDVLSVRRGHINDSAGGIIDNTFGWGVSFLGYAGFDYARIPQFRELQTVDKWAFWVRLPVDFLGG